MNIDKIRSALEFARTRTPAGDPVSSQAEAGLMAIAEVEREFGAARALLAEIERERKRMADEIAIHGKMADSMTAEFAAARALIERAAKAVGPYGLMGPLHAELRAFLEPPGEVAYTYGDAPNPPNSSPLPPAVCMKCGDDRNQPSKFCDHGKATPEPAECGCAARVALGEINDLDMANSEAPRFLEAALIARAARATPCDCAGLREELADLRYKFHTNDHRHDLIVTDLRKEVAGARNSRDVAESATRQFRAELAAMTADRDQWKALKDRVEEEKARLENERAAELEREREAVEALRQYLVYHALPDTAPYIVARYDDRKADVLQAEVLRDPAKGDC